MNTVNFRRLFLGLPTMVVGLMAIQTTAAFAESDTSVGAVTGSNLEKWNLLVAFALPFAIAIAQRPTFAPIVRSIITFAFSVVAGIVTTLLNGSISNWHDLFGSILTILVGALLFYHTLWNTAAKQLEVKTSPGIMIGDHPTTSTGGGTGGPYPVETPPTTHN